MILVDDKSAVMEQKDFVDLLEYSCSLPTGTIIGKRWKRNNNSHFNYDKSKPEDWWMGEYFDINDPNNIGIKWRKIEVVS